jgi:hypothetical protein
MISYFFYLEKSSIFSHLGLGVSYSPVISGVSCYSGDFNDYFTIAYEKSIRFRATFKDQERPMRRTIPHAVLLTRVSAAIQSRGLKAAEHQLVEHRVDVFETRLIEREAFKALFSFNTTLDELGPEDVSGLERARDNAVAFTAEVVQRLKALSGQGEAAEGRRAADARAGA